MAIPGAMDRTNAAALHPRREWNRGLLPVPTAPGHDRTMSQLRKPMCLDWPTTIALFVAALALRVPFRSRYAYHWDGAQFALAMEHYDLRLGQPHAPGYFLYVLLGRLVNILVGDPHASLVWLSVVAGAALVPLGFLLATALYGRACGVAAGAILATSPLCWFH